MKIIVKDLGNGYYFLRGAGVCDFAQVFGWPCSKENLKDGFFKESGKDFQESCLELLNNMGLER